MGAQSAETWPFLAVPVVLECLGCADVEELTRRGVEEARSPGVVRLIARGRLQCIAVLDAIDAVQIRERSAQCNHLLQTSILNLVVNSPTLHHPRRSITSLPTIQFASIFGRPGPGPHHPSARDPADPRTTTRDIRTDALAAHAPGVQTTSVSAASLASQSRLSMFQLSRKVSDVCFAALNESKHGHLLLLVLLLLLVSPPRIRELPRLGAGASVAGNVTNGNLSEAILKRRGMNCCAGVITGWWTWTSLTDKDGNVAVGREDGNVPGIPGHRMRLSSWKHAQQSRSQEASLDFTSSPRVHQHVIITIRLARGISPACRRTRTLRRLDPIEHAVQYRRPGNRANLAASILETVRCDWPLDVRRSSTAHDHCTRRLARPTR